MNTLFKISNELKAETIFCGIITITSKVNFLKTSCSVLEKIDDIIKKLTIRYTKEDIRKIPQIQKVRETMSQLGRSPNRYLNSAEALINRVIAQKSLYQINNIVDFNNYLSLKYFVPVGSYDLNEITGNITLKKGKKIDKYLSLGKDFFNLENLPLLADDKGAFGSIVSDSKRTLIKPNTNQIITVMFFFDDIRSKYSEISNELEQLYSEILLAKEVNISYYE